MNTSPALSTRQILERRRFLIPTLALFVIAGGWLAAHRIFQVDEVQTMHMAWLLSQADAGSYSNSIEMYMIPLSFLSRCFQDPFAYMVACRFIFFALFAASCVILARGVSNRSRPRFFGALLLLGTTPILWDYGFEVRHDNVVILGLSILICVLINRRPGKTVGYLAVSSALGGILFLSSYKSVVLWGPILGYLALLSVIRDRVSILRVIAAVATGIVSAAILALAGHLLLGSLPLYLKVSRSFFGTIRTGPIRFFNWDYLRQFIYVHPWLIALSVLFLILKAGRVVRGLFSGVAFRQNDPQAKRYMLLLLGPVFLALNPTPFPYNYMYVAVLVFPAVFHLTDQALTRSIVRRWIIILTLLLFQFAPGLIQTLRHFYYSNDTQRKITTFVNTFTEPEDCLFDGAGLAMFRKGPGEMWYLHSLNKAGYLAGDILNVRDMLACNPCPVLVKSYKWDFMLPDDFAFIRSRYVPFHQVIWILGCGIHPEAPGEYPFEIHRNGYYAVTTRTFGLPPTLKVDGVSVDSRPVFLRRGLHVLDIQTPSDKVFVLWTKNDYEPLVSVPTVFQPVFINWY